MAFVIKFNEAYIVRQWRVLYTVPLMIWFLSYKLRDEFIFEPTHWCSSIDPIGGTRINFQIGISGDFAWPTIY
jgi:hypothetical protein